MPVRPFVASAAAWVLGAVTAAAVGMLALSLIDTGPAISAQPLVPQYQAHAVPADSDDPTPVAPPTSASPSPTPSTPASASVAPAIIERQLSSPGGTVIARCTGSRVYLVSWSPAPGFHVGKVERGPGYEAEVAFVTHSSAMVLQVRCVGGIPQAELDWHGDR